MKASNCEKNWQEGLSRILVETRDYLSHIKVAEVSKKIVIICDRSGQDKAIQIARVLRDGAKISGDIVDIIVGLEKSSKDDIDHSGRNLKNDLIIREFVWRKINADDGQRILSYTGAQRNLVWPHYLVPDDGINNFLDCDLWFLIASEIDTPLLPLRPLALMPDTIARRFSGRSQKFNVGRFGLAYEPDAVIVDSDFAENEFVHTEGVPLNLIHKLPSILVDDVAERSPKIGTGERSSFLWIVNPRSWPNFEPAVEALSILYNQLSYSKKCNVFVMEIETTGLKSETHPNYKRLIEKAAKRHQIPQRMLNVAKISSPRQLSFAMSEAEFLWRPAELDDDLAPLVAFVKSGKPVIAANCPLLRERLEALDWEICTQSEESPDSMAASIKQMDASRYTSVQSLSNSRPLEQVSSAYWSVVAECL